MDFSAMSLKNLVSDVTTVFTRAKQYAEETIGTAERTELDQDYEVLAERADNYKQWTERIVAKLEAVIQPNPNMRYGEMFIEKMGTEIKRDRLRNLEYLGTDMIDAGIAFGPSTVYGNALVKVGKAQQCLGKTEKEFVLNSYRTIIIPFRKFLEEDMKTVTKERKVLETKRLDLDAAKNRLRKAKSMQGQENPKIKPEMIEKELEEAERDLKIAQDEFDRQIEITKLLLEGISSAQANHVRCLNDFVTAQMEYYNQSYRHMLDLQHELSVPSTALTSDNVAGTNFKSGPTVSTNASLAGDSGRHQVTGHDFNSLSSLEYQSQQLFSIRSPPNEIASEFTLPNGKRRARCLNDYRAQSSDELSLKANEVIIVSIVDDAKDTDWMLGERGSEKGKVPVAYLEIY